MLGTKLKIMQITKNFKLQEFECKCGKCVLPKEKIIEIVVLAIVLQKLRDYVQMPIKINSGYRCSFRNQQVGGVQNSYHMQAKAADISCGLFKGFHLCKIIFELMSRDMLPALFVKEYENFIHIDTRYFKPEQVLRL